MDQGIRLVKQFLQFTTRQPVLINFGGPEDKQLYFFAIPRLRTKTFIAKDRLT